MNFAIFTGSLFEKGKIMNKTSVKNDLNDMVRLLNEDAIFIPKKVLKLDDVYEETKIMFSIILTENRNFINSRSEFPLDEMIEIYKNADITRIKYECFCGEPKATLIKEEMITIAQQLEDILDIPEEHRQNRRRK